MYKVVIIMSPICTLHKDSSIIMGVQVFLPLLHAELIKLMILFFKSHFMTGSKNREQQTMRKNSYFFMPY